MFENRLRAFFEGKCRRFRNPTVPRIIDQFRRKRCQKKLKMWTKNFSKNYPKIFYCSWAVDCRKLIQYSLVQWIKYTFDAAWSKFDSIPHQKCIQFTGPNCTYVCYSPDGLFWLNQYKQDRGITLWMTRRVLILKKEK